MGTRTFESLKRGRTEVMVWCAAKGPSFQVCAECPEPPHHLVTLQLFSHHLTLLVSIINEKEGRHPILGRRAENSRWKLRKKNLPQTHCLSSHFSMLTTEVVDFKHWISKKDTNPYFIITGNSTFLEFPSFSPGGRIKAVKETLGNIPFV